MGTLNLLQLNQRLRVTQCILLNPQDILYWRSRGQFKCQICDHVWSTEVQRFVKYNGVGTGCPKCSGTLKSNTKDFIKKAKQVHGNKYNYSQVHYITARTPVLIGCKKHGIFNQTPHDHARGQGCSSCAGCRRLTNEEFDKKLLATGRNVQRIGSYVQSHAPIEVQCKSCKYIWKAKPTKLCGETATGCPKCRTRNGRYGTFITLDGIQFRSILESKCYEIVRDFCQTQKYCFERQKQYPQSSTNHTCDFYIPNVQLWIEVSGLQTKEYKTRLQKKITWVNEMKENFLFAQTPKKLKDILYGNS